MRGRMSKEQTMASGTDGRNSHDAPPGNAGGGTSDVEPDTNTIDVDPDKDREDLDGPSKDEIPDDEPEPSAT